MSNSRGTGRATKTAPKTRSTAITITVAVVILLFIAALFINSNFIRRQVTAFEANGMKFTTAEYQYFYMNTISEYTNNVKTAYGDYASSMLPDSTKPLDSQTNPLTGETWDVYFKKATSDNLLYYSGAYMEAKSKGFTVSDEDYAKVDADVDSFAAQIAAYYSFPEYLNSQYGSSSGLNEKLYRELNKQQYYVSMYAQKVSDEFTYSDTDIDAYYAENKDKFDVFVYRFFTVRAETLNKEDYETDEAYNEADQAAIEAAREEAAAYVASISDEQDFLAKAKEYNPDTYEKNSSTLYHINGDDLTTTFADWAKDEERKAGDLYTSPTNADEAANRAFYVVYFLERLDNEYPTVNVNLMALSGQTLKAEDYKDDKGEPNEASYNLAIEDSKASLEKKANEIFGEWESNGGTLDFLTNYYGENKSFKYGSLDEFTGSISGSLYENISYSYAEDDPADKWMHDPARQEGDITIVQTKDGYWYLLYFVGTDMTYSDFLADSAKRAADVEAWKSVFTSSTASTRWGMKLL